RHECHAMRLGELQEGVLVRRNNRFLATIMLDGREVTAHVSNPGRMTELLVPGCTAFVRVAEGIRRRTGYDLVLVKGAGTLVSVDTRLPNALVAEAFREERLAVPGFTHMQAEVPLGASRIDFRLTGPVGVCWLECKSVSLVEGGKALFPDAPTVRGVRHLRELAQVAQVGGRAMVLFVIQRDDAVSLEPNDATDPAFGAALREVVRYGVEVRAHVCRVTRQEVRLAGEVPVLLP
ncbi:MAG: DNA/RNA nuclease SfsA, partial [Anaerolineae bacterium]